jgi:CheY-like chemotaxis protein/HPt (histidine-containing phosphotransfer) domain-containing protein
MADDTDKNKGLLPNHRRTARILLIGARESNLEIVSVIAAAGHTVDVAWDDAEVESAVRSQAYDLVMMDVQMPAMNVIGTKKRIRGLQAPGRDIPIIAMTADGRPDRDVEFHAAGMNGRIGKPFDPCRLHALIDRWVPDLALGDASHGARPGDASSCALDPQVYDDLVEVLGPDKIQSLLTKLESQLTRSFAPLPQSIDSSELAREAHSIVSQAGMLGFLTLADLCRDLEMACLSGADIATTLEAVRSARDRAVREIARLRHARRQSAA